MSHLHLVGPSVIARTALFCLALGSGPSLAQQQNDGLVLEEVIVTAQKREESVQDIPSTVNALGGDTLLEFNVFDFSDVEQLTPGLSLTNLDPRNSTISLRGVSFDPDSAATPAVQTYWNEIKVRSNVAFNQLYDMGRIEVLRGPQGTLQGSTSPGGSIQLHTRMPNMEAVDGQIQSTVADNDGFNTQLGLSLPIIAGSLAARIAGVYDQSDLEQIENLNTGTEQSGDTRAGRLTLRWETHSFDMTLVQEYLERVADGFEDVAGADINNQGKPPLDTYDRITLAEFDNEIKQRNKLTAFTINWDFAGHRLTSVNGYQDNIAFALRDTDKGNVIPGFRQLQRVTSDFDINTHELRLASTASDMWEYMVGAYYEKSRSNTINVNTSAAMAGPTPADWLGTANLTLVEIPNNREFFGIFTHNKINFTAATTLQLGLRWQKVRSLARADLNLLPPAAPGQTDVDRVKAASLGIATPLFGLIPDDKDFSDTEEMTGSLKLAHNISDDWMVYSSYDRGFRPGGITITPTALSDELLLFDGETSDAIEIGFKSTLWDGRVQLNGAAFYQQFDGFIARATDISVDTDGDGALDTTVLGGLNYNADAIIRGAELEFTALLTENWTLFAGASYTDAKFDDAEVPCNVEPVPTGQQASFCASSGRAGSEPNWSLSANTEYTLPMESIELFVRGLYKYTDSRANDLITNGESDAYSTTNLFLGVRDKSLVWELSLWAKNLFDEEAQQGILDEQLVTGRQGAAPVPLPSGYTEVRIIPERTVGVTVKYNFAL